MPPPHVRPGRACTPVGESPKTYPRNTHAQPGAEGTVLIQGTFRNNRRFAGLLFLLAGNGATGLLLVPKLLSLS